jgi:hypothetical protein
MPRGFLFRVPAQCKQCQAGGSVSLQQSLKGEIVLLTWCCRMCHADWPVLPSDHVELRQNHQPTILASTEP